MIGLSFAAPAAKLYEVFDKLIIDRRSGGDVHVLIANAHGKKICRTFLSGRLHTVYGLQQTFGSGNLEWKLCATSHAMASLMPSHVAGSP